MIKHSPLIIKTILVSLILHYLFINYFPLEYLERLSLFQKTPTGQPVEIHSRIEATLVRDEDNAEKIEQLGQQGNGEQGDGAQGEQGQGGILAGIDHEKWGDLIDRLEQNTGFKNNFNERYDDDIIYNEVSKRYIHRERKHEDIVIKDVFPTIHNIDQDFEQVLKAAPKKLNEYVERNDIIEQFRSKDSDVKTEITIEYLSSDTSTNLGPLHFPPEERQAFFDKTLANDKTTQLSDFIGKYFQHDPDKGDLPVATRELYLKNLERLLYPFSSDPSYFYLDFYLENLNKEDFLHNALNQAEKLHGSKTATELLFSIERIYEIQQRAWKAYFEFDALYENIPEEKKNRLRVETLQRVNARYQDVLKQKDIDDFADLEQKYLQRRFEITEHIIQHTPDDYRLEDALFEQAVILWQMGISNNDAQKKAQAIEQWQSIIKQAKKNNFSQDAYEDFLNLQHLRGMEALIYVYEREADANKAMREKRISTFLQQRQNQRLADKQKREERLLWPKDEN